MLFFTQQTLSSRLISSIVFLALSGSIIFGGVLLPARQARAQEGFATLAQQIRQFILDKIWQTLDMAIQKMTSYFTGITAAIQTWTKLDILMQRALKLAWNTMRKTLLDQLANSVLNWSRAGEDGQNSFVSNWRAFLSQKTDDAALRFLTDEVDKAPMYENHAPDVRRDVRSIDEYANRESFSQKVTPVVSQTEMDAFYKGDFTWDRWEAALQSNYYIHLFTALDDLAVIRDSTYDAEKNKLIANQGNQGDKGTPGIIKSYAVQRISMMDLDYLLQADDINEYLAALIDAFINRIAREGLDKMKTDDYASQGNQPVVTLPPETVDATYIEGNAEVTRHLRQALGLIKDNLKDASAGARNNLEVMYEIKAAQDSHTCTVTPPIGPEIAAVENAGATYDARLILIDEAILATDNLIIAMDEVLAAKKYGDEEFLQEALDNFKPIHDAAIAIYQQLLETNDINLERIFESVNSYNFELVKQIAGYLEELGSPKRTPKALQDYVPEDTLYARLRLEERAQCP